MRLNRYYLSRYLSRITEISFSDLIFDPCLCICIGFLFLQPQTYIRLILEAVTYENTRRTHAKGDRCLILSERSYCVFTPQGFVTKCFLIFIVNEVKNFAANNLLQVGKLVTYQEPYIFGQSRTRIRVKGWCSYIEEFRGYEAVEGFYCKFIYKDCRV